MRQPQSPWCASQGWPGQTLSWGGGEWVEPSGFHHIVSGVVSGIYFRAKWWLEYILDRPNTLLLSGEECVRHSCSHQLIVGECPKIVVISYEDSHSVISMTAIILNSSLKMLTWRRSVYHGWSPPQSSCQELPSEEKWITNCYVSKSGEQKFWQPDGLINKRFPKMCKCTNVQCFVCWSPDSGELVNTNMCNLMASNGGVYACHHKPDGLPWLPSRSPWSPLCCIICNFTFVM